MALTAAELEELRKYIDEADDTGGWTDVVLSALAEAYKNSSGGYNLRGTASAVWAAKAAEYHALVDTSESGSSRSMSQKFKHAMELAKLFGSDSSSGTDDTIPSPRSTRIVRATREG